MIHDAIESQQISLSDSLAVADKRRRLNIEIDFTSFCAPLVRRLKTFFSVQFKYYRKATQIGKDKPCLPSPISAFDPDCLPSVNIYYVQSR